MDLAVEQLEIALDVFLDSASHVSSLTLAGAAEEILGKEAELSGKGSLLREELEMANHLQRIWPGGETKWKDFIKNKNSARNSAPCWSMSFRTPAAHKQRFFCCFAASDRICG